MQPERFHYRPSTSHCTQAGRRRRHPADGNYAGVSLVCLRACLSVRPLFRLSRTGRGGGGWGLCVCGGGGVARQPKLQLKVWYKKTHLLNVCARFS